MSLVTLRKIADRVARRPAELAEARAAGAKVIGTLGYNMPEEVIHALGLVPVRLGTGGDDRLIEIGSRYISTKNCVFTRACVGLFAERKDPWVAAADAVAFDTTCLHLYRVAELVGYYFKVKTVVLGVPRNFYLPEARAYFRRELEAFTHRLEALAGRALEPRRLVESVALLGRIRRAIRALYTAQAAPEAPIGWPEVFEVVHAGFYLDQEEYLSLLEELLLELKGTRRTGEERIPRPRVLLSGSVIPPGDTKLVDIIERAGGRIVGDDLWSGLAPSVGVEVLEPSLDGLADAYLARLPHGALPYLEQATDGRLAHLRSLVRELDAQGVVYHTLRYCDPFTFKTGETKDVLKALGVPLLDIHTEYAGSDYEAIRTRTEAFVELLRHASPTQEVAA